METTVAGQSRRAPGCGYTDGMREVVGPSKGAAVRARQSPEKRVSHGLVALSSAAVLAVYGAGYLRTKAAADRFELQASERRPQSPAHAASRAALALGGTLEPRAAVVPESQPETAPAAASVPAAGVAMEPAREAARRGVPETPAAAPMAAARPESPVAAVPAPVASAAPAPVAPATASTPTPEPAASAAAPEPAAPPAAKGQYTDGTYLGWGSCRHGDIQASIVIEGGRIASASIAQCLTRYSCSWIAPLVPQVAARQSPEVDYVSGATESSYAFYDALVEALSKAK